MMEQRRNAGSHTVKTMSCGGCIALIVICGIGIHNVVLQANGTVGPCKGNSGTVGGITTDGRSNLIGVIIPGEEGGENAR